MTRKNTSQRHNNLLKESSNILDDSELIDAMSSYQDREFLEYKNQIKDIEDSYNGKYIINVGDSRFHNTAIVLSSNKKVKFYMVVRSKNLKDSGIAIRFKDYMEVIQPDDNNFYDNDYNIEIDSKKLEEMLRVAKAVKSCMEDLDQSRVKGREGWDEYKNFVNVARRFGYK